VRAALQDAASVAGLLVTTEAMVAEAPKKQAAHNVIEVGNSRLRLAEWAA
jgi:chaperonin GroEL